MSWWSCLHSHPCPGTYDGNKFRCRWLCSTGRRIRREGQSSEAEANPESGGSAYVRKLSPGPTSRFGAGPPIAQRPPRPEPEAYPQRGNPMQMFRAEPRCYGEYDANSTACLSCWLRAGCHQSTYGVSSSFVAYPTGSSAIDTGATQVEGGSDMNSKDFATRKAKAQELEVVSVGDDFMVKSSTRQGGYMVTAREEGGYHCACMDFATHRSDSEWKCKHIIAVEDYLEKRGPTNGDSRYDLLDLK